jgi:hypothetical protein
MVHGMNTTHHIQIQLRDRLSDRLATFFEGMTLVDRADGSALVGEIADQAQLHGLLSRIRDLGLELDSVTTDERGKTEDRPDVPTLEVSP